jgi:hypothetical protein
MKSFRSYTTVCLGQSRPRRWLTANRIDGVGAAAIATRIGNPEFQCASFVWRTGTRGRLSLEMGGTPFGVCVAFPGAQVLEQLRIC